MIHYLNLCRRLNQVEEFLLYPQGAFLPVFQPLSSSKESTIWRILVQTGQWRKEPDDFLDLPEKLIQNFCRYLRRLHKNVKYCSRMQKSLFTFFLLQSLLNLQKVLPQTGDSQSAKIVTAYTRMQKRTKCLAPNWGISIC